MQTPRVSHLGILREGFSQLGRHPVQTLLLALLAMALAQVAPALELAAGAAPSLLVQSLFAFTALLPLEMYFIPRYQVQLDAERLDRAGNPAADWRAGFDQRWLKVFLVRLGLSVAVGFGLVLFLIPGILILGLFGWAPLRMLLRGDGALDALRWSQTTMARQWPRVVQAVLALLTVALVYQAAAGWTLERLVPVADPDLVPGALVRLKHPAFWCFNFTGGLMNLWLSSALLALYQRLEAPGPQSSSAK